MPDTATCAALANIAVTAGGFFFFLIKIMNKQTIQSVLLKTLSEQFTSLSKTVEDLRRGDGWITHRRSSIEGEYPHPDA